MTETVSIPCLQGPDEQGPGWVPTRTADGLDWERPRIKCKCGKVLNIDLHHIDTSGRVSPSFYHNENPPKPPPGFFYTPGCGWHVYLVLKDYACGEFPSLMPKS